LPTKQELANIKSERNEDVLLVLDSSVCLDIINLIRNKQSARVDKQKVFNLIEYVQKNKVKTTPVLALSELCYDRNSFKLLEDKMWDFKNKIDFAFDFPIKLLKRYEYDYETNYFVFRKPELRRTSIEPYVEQLNLYYAALLKIREISKCGLKSQLAEKNLLTFKEWMVKDLDVILGPEFSLAIQIFGGNTKYRSMIKLDANREKAQKALWGTAWDLFHARVSCNKIQFSQIVGRPVQSIFVTKDGNLYSLLAPHVEYCAKYNSTKFSITNKNTYAPHYSDSFMHEFNMAMLDLAMGRMQGVISPNQQKVSNIITELEKNLT
jgi:hypothetical protein